TPRPRACRLQDALHPSPARQQASALNRVGQTKRGCFSLVHQRPRSEICVLSWRWRPGMIKMRRGYYELGVKLAPCHRLPVAFVELVAQHLSTVVRRLARSLAMM